MDEQPGVWKPTPRAGSEGRRQVGVLLQAADRAAHWWDRLFGLQI